MRTREFVDIDVGQHDAGAFREKTLRRRPADAARGAGDVGDPPGQGTRRRHALQLRFLQRPVLDRECLALVEPDVAVDPRRAADDVDRIAVELARNASGRLVPRESQHTETRHEEHDRVRVAHGRAVGATVTFIVGAILLAVLGYR